MHYFFCVTRIEINSNKETNARDYNESSIVHASTYFFLLIHGQDKEQS